MTATGLCAGCPLADEGRGGGPRINVSGPAHPDLVLVGGFPGSAEARAGTPFSRGRSTLLRRVMAGLTAEPAGNPTADPRGTRAPETAYACAARCPLPEDVRVVADREVIVERCAPQLMTWLDRAAPKVVVALGNDALAALGFRERARALRGGVHELALGLSKRALVVATYHILEVDRSPGLLPTLRNDLAKALRLVRDGMTGLPLTLRAPVAASDVLEALDQAGAAIRERAESTGQPVALAVHVEPHGRPASPSGRVLSVGLSWAAGQGLAVPLEHPQAPFSAADSAAVRDALGRVLTSPAARLAACDAKAAVQWLALRCGVALRNFGYDALLAEHILEEDKGNGNYELATLIRDRFPSLGRYEARREHLLAELAAGRERRAGEEREAHARQARQAMEDWWLDLPGDARLKCLGAWVDKHFLLLSETHRLRDARRGGRKGRPMAKRFRAALDLMLAKVPPEEAPGFRPPEPDVHGAADPPPLLPLDALLTDSAVRATAVRMLIGDQLKRFARDEALAARARRQCAGSPAGPAAPTALSGLHAVSLPLAACLAHMEFHGIRFDRDLAARYADSVFAQREAALDALRRETGRAFNPAGKAPDTARLLYEDMGLPVPRRTESGLPATDAETLAELARLHHLPFLDTLLACRKLEACLHVLQNWLTASAADGRIHAVFSQTATPTFRVTCSGPNLQGVPAAAAGLNLKKLFLPDSDAHELCLADIAHADLRVLTAYSRDRALIRVLAEGGDPHSLTAAELTPFGYEDLAAHKHRPDSEQYRARQLGKKVNFGIIYCMSARGLRRQLRSELGLELSEEDCQDYLDRYFAAHPGAAAYIASTISFVRHHHFTTTLTGRRRRFPMAAYTAAQAARMSRQAVNARLQITTADLVARNLTDVHNAVLPLGGRMLLCVYDALLFQVPRDTDIAALLDRAIVENTARTAPWLPVPWTYDMGRGPSYGETEDKAR